MRWTKQIVELLTQHLLAIYDVYALTHMLEPLARKVIDTAEGRLLELRKRGKCDACGFGWSESLVGNTLEFEGADAETCLPRKVDNDSQRHLGFLGKAETETSVHELTPSYSFSLANLIAYHHFSFADDKTALLSIAAIAERDTKPIPASWKENGLPETVIEKWAGKTAPLRLESDVAAMCRINVCSCGNATSNDSIGILPLGAAVSHGKSEETTAVVGVDRT